MNNYKTTDRNHSTNFTGALSYEVDVTRIQSSNEDVEERNLAPTANTQIVINGLEPGREYQFSIRAIGNENRESGAHPEFRDATRRLLRVRQDRRVACVYCLGWLKLPSSSLCMRNGATE